MEALKFFIKDHKYIILLYGVCLFIGILLLVYDIFRISNDDINKTMLRFLVRSLLLFPALIFYFADFKKLVLVYRDYKTQKTETKNLYILDQDFKKCKDEFNGVYNIIRCSENKNDHNYTECWLYKNNLIYDDLKIGSQYKLTYYINSKCLCGIEPTISNNAKANKQKVNAYNKNLFQNNTQEKLQTTDAEPPKNKLWVLFVYIIGICTMPFSVYILLQLWHVKNIIDNFYLLFCTVGISAFILYFLLIYKFVNSILLYSKTPKIVVDKFITIGIPVVHTSLKSNKSIFCLKVQNSKKTKKDLFFYSTDILGLGDLNERPGYLGYGDFIGMEYEIAYYKISHVIKSMKLIGGQSGDGWLR